MAAGDRFDGSEALVSWSHSTPVIEGCCGGPDGGRLNVHLGGIADPVDFASVDERQKCAMDTWLNIVLTRWTCWPMSEDAAQDVDEVAAATVELIRDFEALVRGLYVNLIATYFGNDRSCGQYQLTNSSLLEPSGGCAGFVVVVRGRVQYAPDYPAPPPGTP